MREQGEIAKAERDLEPNWKGCWLAFDGGLGLRDRGVFKAERETKGRLELLGLRDKGKNPN